ncbi:MAG: hypothetical protein ACYSRZ_04180 [Planctomycetota bacterium]|jgi:hypothetical protein
MKTLKRFIILTMVLILTAGPLALGTYTPVWRGMAGSTFQEWDFSTDDPFPLPELSTSFNPYGTTELMVDGHGWVDEFGSRSGIWALSGQIDVHIPNRPVIEGEKGIWVQLIWKGMEVSPNPYLPEEPIIGIAPFDFMTMARNDEPLDPLDEGWVYSLFEINIWPNPIEEWVVVKGDIIVDYLSIDTICLPEPATLLLFGAAGLLNICSKKKK